MVDFSPDIFGAMSYLLAFTGRVSIFHITITQWVYNLFILGWSVLMLQRTYKTFYPDAQFMTDPIQVDGGGEVDTMDHEYSEFDEARYRKYNDNY